MPKTQRDITWEPQQKLILSSNENRTEHNSHLYFFRLKPTFCNCWSIAAVVLELRRGCGLRAAPTWRPVNAVIMCLAPDTDSPPPANESVSWNTHDRIV